MNELKATKQRMTANEIAQVSGGVIEKQGIRASICLWTGKSLSNMA